MVVRSLLTVMFLMTFVVSAAILAPSLAVAQDGNTVFDWADVLTDAQERDVQAAFEEVSAETGDPVYAFLEAGTNTPEADRDELLLETAREAGAPEDAAVMLVDTEDRWGLVDVSGGSDQAVYDSMKPYFQDGQFADGLIAGAAKYQDSLSVLPELLTTGGVLGAMALLIGGTFFFWNRRRKERELEEQRQAAEREFAELTGRMDEFGEKERLVAGYLEAQRPLLDQRCEEQVEARIQDARSAGFGNEFNEAASRLASDPRGARERIEHGRRLLDDALVELDEVENTIDHYRAADDSLEGRLRLTADEIAAAERAEATAAENGASVEPLGLKSEYDRLAREIVDRETRRDEFDPREVLVAVDALAEDARRHRASMEAEVSARAALPEERSAAEGALSRARGSLEEYGRAYAAEQTRWGPAALETAPSPEELSAGLRDAASSVESSRRAENAGRFAEARSSLQRAAQTARTVMLAPGELKSTVAEADRKRREGEERLQELEARLERAKARSDRMSPRQRRRLQEYERDLGEARGGFFGSDWLTAILVFEALDTDYVYVDGGPAGDFGGGFDGGDFGGGDWGGFGGGDFGGGGF